MTSAGALAILLATTALCAAGERPQPNVKPDPLVIPDTAVAVSRIQRFRADIWMPVNNRMLALRSRDEYYLVVFNQVCYGLAHGSIITIVHTDPVEVRRSALPTLSARYDAISTGGYTAPCRIAKIYSVLAEDVEDLQPPPREE
jgi:Family of unknown function (DUF6491)